MQSVLMGAGDWNRPVQPRSSWHLGVVGRHGREISPCSMTSARALAFEYKLMGPQPRYFVMNVDDPRIDEMDAKSPRDMWRNYHPLELPSAFYATSGCQSEMPGYMRQVVLGRGCID